MTTNEIIIYLDEVRCRQLYAYFYLALIHACISDKLN